jgi:hypothetical protein
VLHAYAEGVSLSRLLRGVRLARRLLPVSAAAVIP